MTGRMEVNGGAWHAFPALLEAPLRASARAHDSGQDLTKSILNRIPHSFHDQHGVCGRGRYTRGYA